MRPLPTNAACACACALLAILCCSLLWLSLKRRRGVQQRGPQGPGQEVYPQLHRHPDRAGAATAAAAPPTLIVCGASVAVVGSLLAAGPLLTTAACCVVAAQACQSIYPLKDVFIRKVKTLKAPKFDITKLMEVRAPPRPAALFALSLLAAALYLFSSSSFFAHFPHPLKRSVLSPPFVSCLFIGLFRPAFAFLPCKCGTIRAPSAAAGC